MFLFWWHLGCNCCEHCGFIRWFLNAILEASRHANMIQDVSKMYGIKILEVLCSLWDFDCLCFQKCVYLVYLSIIISALESIQAYGAQLVTVAIAQFRWVTWHALEIFEASSSSNHRFFCFFVHKTLICALNQHNGFDGSGSQPMHRIWSQHEVIDPMCRALWQRKNPKRDREVEGNDWRWKKDRDETTEKQGLESKSSDICPSDWVEINGNREARFQVKVSFNSRINSRINASWRFCMLYHWTCAVRWHASTWDLRLGLLPKPNTTRFKLFFDELWYARDAMSDGVWTFLPFQVPASPFASCRCHQ